jgi:hypothetical protein
MQSVTFVKDMWKEELKNLQRLQILATQNSTTLYKIDWHGKHFAESVSMYLRMGVSKQKQ